MKTEELHALLRLVLKVPADNTKTITFDLNDKEERPWQFVFQGRELVALQQEDYRYNICSMPPIEIFGDLKKILPNVPKDISLIIAGYTSDLL